MSAHAPPALSAAALAQHAARGVALHVSWLLTDCPTLVCHMHVLRPYTADMMLL
jgi:hypothetical protein